MRLLVLVTDAFGGRGGIAKFNRDLLAALCSSGDSTEITAVPRVIVDPLTGLPATLRYLADYAGGKRRYVRGVLAETRAREYDGVICGHLNLIPLAWYVARRYDVPLLLIVHGIEAWEPSRNPLVRMATRRLAAVVSVSEFTKRRFLAWTGLSDEIAHVVPNCIDEARFGTGVKSAELLQRYRLDGRTVLLTVGRLASAERYKGFDEVIELLPDLAQEIPEVAYLIVGEGRDRERLQIKARRLGVEDRVVFAGYVIEDEKADHYRLADVFVLPSRAEGFGIVHLEALACGVPVVASSVDGSREAVLDGTMGEVVDPDQPDELKSAIIRALRRERRVPEALSHFSDRKFQSRWHAVVKEVFRRRVS